MIRRMLPYVALVGLVACAPRYGPPPAPPFSRQQATVPDSVDQMLLYMELWRTRLGLSECLVDTAEDGPQARVSLVTLDLFVSSYGTVDSVAAASRRATPRMLDCARQVVRTWMLGEHPAPQRYRFTMPMSPRLAEAELGGPLDARVEADRQTMRGVMVGLHRSRQSLAECYLFARPVRTPMGAPTSGGMVVVRFIATPEGDVTDAAVVESTVPTTGLDSCLVATVRGWKLPEGRGGVFEFPITFAPEEGAAPTTARDGGPAPAGSAE